MKTVEHNIKLVLPEYCPDHCPAFNPVSDLQQLYADGKPIFDRIEARCSNERSCPVAAYLNIDSSEEELHGEV